MMKKMPARLFAALLAGLLAALVPLTLPAGGGGVDFARRAAAEEATDEAAQQAAYDEAQALFDAQSYEEAYRAFEALGRFSDSRARASESKKKWKAERYGAAMNLYDAEQYAQAMEIFKELDDYRESRSYYYKSEIAHLRSEYKRADELFDAGDYESARLIFDSLGTYHISRDRVKECDEMLAAQRKAEQERQCYENGLALKAAGDLAAARDAFIEAGDCEGATDQLYAVIDLMAQSDPSMAISPDAPRFSAKQLRDDKTSPKSQVFTAPDGTRHRYQIFKGVHKWVEAKAFCEVLGGHLATLTTEEENAFVYGFMRESGYLTAYFGLSDEARVGDWVWVTGEPFEYANWHRGEPSRSGRERYGMYFYKHTDGTWNDSHFYEDAEVDPGCSFICEWDE